LGGGSLSGRPLGEAPQSSTPAPGGRSAARGPAGGAPRRPLAQTEAGGASAPRGPAIPSQLSPAAWHLPFVSPRGRRVWAGGRSQARRMPGRPRFQTARNVGTAIARCMGQHKETTRGRFHQPNTVLPTFEIVSGLNSNRTQPKSPPTTGVQPHSAHQPKGISPLWCPWRKRQGHFPDCKKVKLAMQEWAEAPVPGPAWSRQGSLARPCQFGLYSV
jgi:hypothetical protein